MIYEWFDDIKCKALKFVHWFRKLFCKYYYRDDKFRISYGIAPHRCGMRDGDDICSDYICDYKYCPKRKEKINDNK